MAARVAASSLGLCIVKAARDIPGASDRLARSVDGRYHGSGALLRACLTSALVHRRTHGLRYARPSTPFGARPFGARVARRLREEHVIWLTTTAQLTPGEPPADQVPAYVDKYRDHLRRLNYTPESFAAAYSVAMRVR